MTGTISYLMNEWSKVEDKPIRERSIIVCFIIYILCIPSTIKNSNLSHKHEISVKYYFKQNLENTTLTVKFKKSENVGCNVKQKQFPY